MKVRVKSIAEKIREKVKARRGGSMSNKYGKDRGKERARSVGKGQKKGLGKTSKPQVRGGVKKPSKATSAGRKRTGPPKKAAAEKKGYHKKETLSKGHDPRDVDRPKAVWHRYEASGKLTSREERARRSPRARMVRRRLSSAKIEHQRGGHKAFAKRRAMQKRRR